MELEAGLQAAATITLAAAAGRIVCARLPIPLPVFLLIAGVVLGRDGFEVVRTDELGSLAPLAITLAVALIVFEGGTLLPGRSLLTLAPVLRNLVLGGLIVTPLVGMLAAGFILDFPWRVAALFGALVCVTGPSVIGPLLQSVRVNPRLRVLLMGEGVIIDPFGALLTLFLLQLAVAESLDLSGPVSWAAGRIGVGLLAGAIGAAVVYVVPRVVKRLTSREVSLLVIGAAIATFAVAESIAHEAGLTAMVLMGITVGNLHLPHREETERFQESIVAFLVATVYVLLAASIPLSTVRDLWPEGFIVVAVLLFVGRPLLVALASFRSDVTYRERLFLSAVAPRGVVAASLAGVVALEAGTRLGGDAEQFVALVFVVILVSIGLQSAYAGPLARRLKVLPMRTVVAGYGEVGRRVALKLRETGESVLVIEAEDALAVAAREEGFETILGDVALPEVLKKARLGEARSLILATGNDDRALLAASLARGQFGCDRIYARVFEPANVPAFERAGVSVVSPQAAVADELAALAGPDPLGDVLAAVEGDMGAMRVTVTNPEAQRRIQDIPALRGGLVVLIRRAGASMIPTGRTLIALGDTLTIVAADSELERIRHALESRDY